MSRTGGEISTGHQVQKSNLDLFHVLKHASPVPIQILLALLQKLRPSIILSVKTTSPCGAVNGRAPAERLAAIGGTNED